MTRPVKVTALDANHLAVYFADGLCGVIDMSSSIGKGVFAPLQDPQFFAQVHIGDHGQIAWNNEIEICPDAAYLEALRQPIREPIHA